MQQIDPRGPRFGAAITATLSLIGLYLSLEANPAAGGLTALLFALFLWSVLHQKSHPYTLIFQKLVRPRLAAPDHLEDARPPRFAQQVGFSFATLGLIGLAIGSPLVMAISFVFIFVAAFLNAAFDYCLGCQMYLLLKRAGLLGK